VSDHLPNYLLLVDNRVKHQLHRPTVRLFSEKAKQQFRDQLLAVDWNGITQESDVNIAFDKFSTAISTCFNASFHKVRLSRRRARDKEWITTALKKSSRTKAKLHKRWLLTKSKEDEERFKNYRRTLIRYQKNVSQSTIKYYLIRKVTRLNNFGKKLEYSL
jgi:hypothetical protein